jgi:hypothetical protein
MSLGLEFDIVSGNNAGALHARRLRLSDVLPARDLVVRNDELNTGSKQGGSKWNRSNEPSAK